MASLLSTFINNDFFSVINMPRRNFLFLLAICVISIICYQKVQINQYGQVLSESLSLINRFSLEKVDSEELFEGAMDGMVGRLDEYSAYIPPSSLSEFQEDIEQQFGGVGLEVSIDPATRQIVVVSPREGSPAAEAGVRSGDKILRINNQSTQGMSMKDAVSLMRGKPGDPVEITVLHLGSDKPVDIKIVRAIIKSDTVLGDTRNPDGSWNFFLAGKDRIGYVRITSFGEKTTDDLRTALQWLVAHEMRGLILDLRDDPGGLLSAAIEICDMFIKSGTIVSTRGRDGNILNAWQATGKGEFTGFPMVVLVNHYSASASEIVSACLQDHHRAKIVGERTWGKGTVQQVIELGDRSGALKLTTASYWRPSNKNIHRVHDAPESADWGVKPDEGCEVKVDDDERVKLHLGRRERDTVKAADNAAAANQDTKISDRQLLKAIECLEKEF